MAAGGTSDEVVEIIVKQEKSPHGASNQRFVPFAAATTAISSNTTMSNRTPLTTATSSNCDGISYGGKSCT